jgi:hypothetical protein
MQRSDRATEETIAVDHRRDVRLLVPLSWLPDLICRRSEPLPQPWSSLRPGSAGLSAPISENMVNARGAISAGVSTDTSRIWSYRNHWTSQEDHHKILSWATSKRSKFWMLPIRCEYLFWMWSHLLTDQKNTVWSIGVNFKVYVITVFIHFSLFQQTRLKKNRWRLRTLDTRIFWSSCWVGASFKTFLITITMDVVDNLSIRIKIHYMVRVLLFSFLDHLFRMVLHGLYHAVKLKYWRHLMKFNILKFQVVCLLLHQCRVKHLKI